MRIAIKLDTEERRLVRESIDELLLTVNNHCCLDYKQFSPEGYKEALKCRAALRKLRRRFPR